ncbi:undecaprenyldiphospho-muramoylpentapeptide beta-N-acetylglucosaminyltransferase [Methylomonas sp. LW13]|uniref:undecaprenyldiphospho-muramoylpentapeptide beta-N-acetylglucosaminyltransferase n=1 Tax=unclassified Methylomonas TaxID=2608980 RepID=UPI00051B0B05|nr:MULTISPECIES: undecaprenyldiphospho-muramoylpentapeptide beta-N-acetylglucosaminyltransferase [unclassified Methylomonas]PKD40084.1 undecaprenyldiphospho-muramoylpentapeptide beta-N-acetylglucosaminyltransferase [Methylomonas sp. Kb3]QBC29500.1 undecaprenyldiphospho-muramoylpentapeptide beta-N-acetylglucosaminyltransferase [Methylomonas sp. LW13]
MSGRIVIMAGGTGGHVFPALAVAQEMRARGWQVSWLGTEKGLESWVVPANNIDIDWLAVAGMRGKGLFSKLAAGFKLIQACLQARRILKQRQPDVVLGMGGFVAGPGGLMAKWLGIPLVIHEQNRVPGTTNRLLVKLAARKVLEAFPDSFAKSVKAICTGNPLRDAFIGLPEKSEWHPQAGRNLRILILGGSQGAKVLNDTVPAALAGLTNLDVKHQTGSVMQAEVAERYRALGLNAEAVAFIEDMAGTYQWADLIICRAGAMTVSEVAACGLPAIFVPLLHAIDDHQTANAKYLTEAGAALLLPQPELNADNLRKTLERAMTSLTSMSRAAKAKARLAATQTVADICVAEAAV